jgi:hypothetical protein
VVPNDTLKGSIEMFDSRNNQMGTKLSKKSGTKTELRNKANPDTSIYIK